MLSPASTSHDSPSTGGQLAFLRRITHDGEFRARVESDPQTALDEYGLHVDPEDVPTKVTLPRGEALLEILIDVEDDSGFDGIWEMWACFVGE